MGTGFTMWFPVGKGRPKDRRVYEDYFKGVGSVVPGWEPWTYFGEDGFRIRLAPIEEDIYCIWEDRMLQVSARTNSAGPGYHAYLIDVMDGLGIAPADVEDETGYYEHRDFGKLQGEMANWLQNLSEKVIEMSAEGGYADLTISMTTDQIPTDTGRFTSCPLGHFERGFFERAQKDTSAAAEFFVWWNRERDAAFFRNVALHLIHCEVNWLPPETDAEREAVAATLACLEKAYSMDPGLDYPAPEWEELALLSGGTWSEAAHPGLMERSRQRRGGSQEKLGYARGSLSQSVGCWRFVRDGMMHYDMEENGVSVWWDDDVTIRASTISVQQRDDIVDKSRSLLQSATRGEEGWEPLTLRDPEIPACIMHKTVEEDGEPLLMTRMAAALEGELLLLDVYYVDGGRRGQAAKVCESVTSS